MYITYFLKSCFLFSILHSEVLRQVPFLFACNLALALVPEPLGKLKQSVFLTSCHCQVCLHALLKR